VCTFLKDSAANHAIHAEFIRDDLCGDRIKVLSEEIQMQKRKSFAAVSLFAAASMLLAHRPDRRGQGRGGEGS
jgi:hypothetical protein